MKRETPKQIKQNLKKCILDMQEYPDLFVKNPGKDFSRKRKISFYQTIDFLLSMKGNTIRKEWLDYGDYKPDKASVSALLQQREKILPEAIGFLFHTFTDTFSDLNTFRGYRLLACDGSDLAIAYNPKDTDTYRRHNSIEKNEKGYNQLHLNALYDLQNRIYLDAVVQPGRHPNEAQALIDMVKRSQLKEKVLLIADRGYESYNILAHLQEKGWKYLIRVKDLGSKGIITNLTLPGTPEFNCAFSLILTKKQTKENHHHPSNGWFALRL